jgi:hypothetical protein
VVVVEVEVVFEVVFVVVFEVVFVVVVEVKVGVVKAGATMDVVEVGMPVQAWVRAYFILTSLLNRLNYPRGD